MNMAVGYSNRCFRHYDAGEVIDVARHAADHMPAGRKRAALLQRATRPLRLAAGAVQKKPALP